MPHDTRRRNGGESASRALRAELAARLRGRSGEIERAILGRVRSVSEAVGDEDPAYADGLRRTITESLVYCIESVEKGPGWSGPVPPEPARQARRAARDGVGVDTLLRRYTAGSKVLEEFIMVEGEHVPRPVLVEILRDQGPQVDRLMGYAAAEHERELGRTRRSSVETFAQRVLRLLTSDEPRGAEEFGYDFDAWHVGLILTGPRAEAAAQLMAERLGYRSLRIERDRETAWAWLGSARRPDVAKLQRSLVDNLPAEISLAIGEARRGLEGWRLTHREAQVGLQVMLQKPGRFIRARDVVLLAAILRDDTLVRSLLDSYLAPLEGRSGEVLRETLRAYLSAGGNAAAAAAGLGVSRHTVQRRIRTIEETIGQLLPDCQAQLQVALQLDDLAH